MTAPAEQAVVFGFEHRVKLLTFAAKCGLSSMYDASRDSYSGWAEKVLLFVELLEKEKNDRTI